MAEIWDLYDREGRPTGGTMERGQVPPAGTYHLVVHVWPTNSSGRVLIQRRADHLASNPSVWAATGGAAITGEDSLTAAMRETEEELGIAFGREDFTFGSRLVRKSSIADIWYVRVAEHLVDGFAPSAEVSAILWVDLDEIPDLMTRGAFFDYGPEYIDVVRANRP